VNRDDFNVATSLYDGVASSSSYSNFICNSKTDIRRIRGTLKRLLLLFKQKHHEWAQTSGPASNLPKGKPLGSHMPEIWLVEYPVHPYTPTVIGWTKVVGCTKNQVLGRSLFQAIFQP
jgi:hypothetical protein